jgi:FrmR/RcnR family transcriptional regulator, repressor of frmRAB operon
MPHTVEEKKSAVRRLRRISGQAQALERSIEEGVECGSALQQLAALRGAVNSLMAEVLESHLRESFGRSAKQKGHGKDTSKAVAKLAPMPDIDTTITEAVSLVRSYLK